MVHNITITDVNIFPVKNPDPGSTLLGFAKVVLNEALVISGIRIVNGKNGPFLGFPNNYNKDTKESYDIVFPITADLRNYISAEVLGEYEKKLEYSLAYAA